MVKGFRMKLILNNTTSADQQIATSSLEYFLELSDQLKKKKSRSVKIKVGETEEFITIPKEALTLLSSIISMMSSGKSVTLMPTDTEMSTQQAAQVLNVSRPHLIKMLESGEIPFRKVGSHRRILLQDIIAYTVKLEKEREKQLAFLAKQAQELNLGYE